MIGPPPNGLSSTKPGQWLARHTRWLLPLLAFLGGYLLQSGWGYSTPSAKLAALEKRTAALEARALADSMVDLNRWHAYQDAHLFLRDDMRFLTDMACAGLLEARPRADTRETIHRCRQIAGLAPRALPEGVR